MRAFESRTEVWREVGLGAEINRGDARKAGREAIVLLILIIGVIIAFDHRDSLFPDAGKGLRYVTAADHRPARLAAREDGRPGLPARPSSGA